MHFFSIKCISSPGHFNAFCTQKNKSQLHFVHKILKHKMISQNEQVLLHFVDILMNVLFIHNFLIIQKAPFMNKICNVFLEWIWIVWIFCIFFWTILLLITILWNFAIFNSICFANEGIPEENGWIYWFLQELERLQ